MNSKTGLFARLGKTREALSRGLAGIFSSSRSFDESDFEELEDQLIMADMGVELSQHLVSQLRKRVSREKPEDAAGLVECLREEIHQVLQGVSEPAPAETPSRPRIVLMVGVNGVGKTTTVSKIAAREKAAGNHVMLAACDTFRAAAIEQLKSWGEKLDIPVIAQAHGSDAAAVAFDAVSSAQARGVDVLFIDTAGRQHTHGDLMEQLKKLRRVIDRVIPGAPHEVLITVDAGNGQNAISQVESFNSAIPLTGLCVTKLDGTARGGVVVALARKFGIPIRFVGVGEGVDDLRQFDAREFANALIPDPGDREET